jgi:hypothetical protein
VKLRPEELLQLRDQVVLFQCDPAQPAEARRALLSRRP